MLVPVRFILICTHIQERFTIYTNTYTHIWCHSTKYIYWMLLLFEKSYVTLWDTALAQPHSSSEYISKYHKIPFYQISYDTSNKYLLLLYEKAHVTLTNIFCYFMKSFLLIYKISSVTLWNILKISDIAQTSATLVQQILFQISFIPF